MKQGIKNPIGMCLQDAGWKTGPWLNAKQSNTRYITWYDYFKNVAAKPTTDWNVTQEDIQVSLVWGSQKLQQIAQRVRSTENKLIQVEKLSAIAQLHGVYNRPDDLIDEAWRNLLLAQHHDCWIVPIHWFKKAMQWLDKSDQLAEDIIADCKKQLTTTNNKAITIINTSGVQRKEIVRVKLPLIAANKSIAIEKADGTKVLSQINKSSSIDSIEVIFQAEVPATAASIYKIVEKKNNTAVKQNNQHKENNYLLETDLYRLGLDPATGAVKSLITKKDDKEWIDKTTSKRFNEIGGYFYNQQRFLSSIDQKNEIRILENGPLEKTAEITGKIGDHSFVQKISLKTGQPAIDFETTIRWKNSEGVGDGHAQRGGYDSKDVKKAFYVDTSKLCIYFPTSLHDMKVYKDAPFDVTESRLDNTFFSTWDSIKNNIIYRWVDIADRKQNKGLALFSDHTTSYSQGKNFPLALTIAYSGMGLWNGNYQLQDSTEINYAVIPHSGKWDDAKLNTAASNIAEPLIVIPGNIKRDLKSIIDLSETGYELTSFNLKNNKLIARFYNAEGKTTPVNIKIFKPFEKATWINLDGTPNTKAKVNGKAVMTALPKHGIATLEITLTN
ncbi:glycoside hydrolase family 38 C-terminal domain-containing protein [Niabella ginsengisoli]|uniref:Glycosyl hydrolase family 38 C-terminal domain-containing protein n=1 Tax=Niabella ginsengisoli TaxID=522298 RepID=A0ABS9SDN7_9BACT|nr:glycoside hydrolase family 38 C-terminal domain-containing protein [Niabella ginsengisoli]MCH5596471.1 hypothetical protein [Niabella ginsengisoli]